MAIGRLLQQVLTGVMSPFRPHHHRTVRSRERIRLDLNVRQFDTRMLHVLLAAELPPPFPPVLSVCAVIHYKCFFNVCPPATFPSYLRVKDTATRRAGVFISICLIPSDTRTRVCPLPDSPQSRDPNVFPCN